MATDTPTAPTALAESQLSLAREFGLEVRLCADPSRGNGVFAGKAGVPDGALVFTEAPVVGMQHRDNAAAVLACQRCFRPVGSLVDQVRRLLESGDDPAAVGLMPSSGELPYSSNPDGSPRGCDPVRCRNDCSVVFCSKECEAACYDTWHALLCDKGDDMPPGTGAGGGAGGAENPGWLHAFYQHADDTNETFLLAARAVSMISSKFLSGDSYEVALQPFSGLQRPVWWDAVSTPADATEEEKAALVADRESMKEFATESWTLLKDAFVGRFPPLSDCPMFQSVIEYARLMGMFERNNCALVAPSVVEDYFLDLDEVEDTAAAAITAPILDALDARYCTPVDGTGLFQFQALLNHSCVSNVSFLKREEDVDGRVVVTAQTDISPGEELVHSYIDEGMSLEDRTEALAGYGFVCMCQLCVFERGGGGGGGEEEETEAEAASGK